MALTRGVEVVIGSDAPRRNIADYSVIEDSTPTDPSDNTGGYGQINIDFGIGDDVSSSMGKVLSLTDGSLGETVGTVRAISDDGVSYSVQANSRLGVLAVERTIQPFIGTLGDGIEYYLSLCGITSGIVIEDWLYTVDVQLPGSRSNVHDQIKKLTAAHGFEMSLVSNNVVCRATQQRQAVNYRDADITRTFDQNGMAQTVSAYSYESYSGTHLAYPPHGDVAEADVYQVNANETQVYDIPIDASLSAVTQPTCVTTVSETDLSASQYCVTGSDGVAISPERWLTSGGSVTVSIDETTRSLALTLHGANLPTLAPFRIGVAKNETDYYSSLRILGTGVFWERKLVTIYVSQDEDFAPDEVGTVIDNEYMETEDQTFHRLLFAAERYGTDAQVIRVSSGGINRVGESGSAAYPTIGDVAAMYPGATISSIFTQLGPTIADWNAELFATVQSDFTNQAFGNLAGARVFDRGSWYRVRTGTISPGGVDYTAERDNLLGDVYYTGETIGQWNTRWAGKTIRDVNIAPIAY